jgi:hypothetical protein
VAGFIRMWKPLGIVMCLCAIVPNIWPAWATGAATVSTFLFGGGDVTVIAICGLLAIGLTLTISPVVYQTLEKIQFVKIGAVLVFLAVAVVAAIGLSDWGDTSDAVTHFGQFPGELEIALILGAFAFAGAGGTNNLVQSNWIRDKGFGMGSYAPRIVSPITGEEEAAPATGVTFPPDEENLRRWDRWWKVANKEQFFAFFMIGTLTIIVFSMVAYSTVFGENVGEDLDFIQGEGNALKERSARGSAPCSGRSARSRSSPPRSGSPTTCRGSWRTCSRSATCASPSVGLSRASTRASCGRSRYSASRSCSPASTSRCCSP